MGIERRFIYRYRGPSFLAGEGKVNGKDYKRQVALWFGNKGLNYITQIIKRVLRIFNRQYPF